MRVIELSGGHVCVVDDEDYDELAQYRWSSTRGYAYRKVKMPDGKKVGIQMHRIIMKAKKGEVVDHKNGDISDNRKENLRICTMLQNRANSKIRTGNASGFKGVCFDKKNGSRPYRAGLRINGKFKHLGMFSTPEEAHAKYCEAAKELYGEFARFN